MPALHPPPGNEPVCTRAPRPGPQPPRPGSWQTCSTPLPRTSPSRFAQTGEVWAWARTTMDTNSMPRLWPTESAPLPGLMPQVYHQGQALSGYRSLVGFQVPTPRLAVTEFGCGAAVVGLGVVVGCAVVVGLGVVVTTASRKRPQSGSWQSQDW